MHYQRCVLKSTCDCGRVLLTRVPGFQSLKFRWEQFCERGPEGVGCSARIFEGCATPAGSLNQDVPSRPGIRYALWSALPHNLESSAEDFYRLSLMASSPMPATNRTCYLQVEMCSSVSLWILLTIMRTAIGIMRILIWTDTSGRAIGNFWHLSSPAYVSNIFSPKKFPKAGWTGCWCCATCRSWKSEVPAQPKSSLRSQVV